MPNDDSRNTENNESAEDQEDSSSDDDTQQEDSSEASDALDSDSANDEDSEESDYEESSDDSDEDDISQKYFTDPKSLPPELSKAFKKMQGIYTRKMQSASLSIEKADAFDKLMEVPQIRAIVEGKAPDNSRSSSDDDEDIEFSEDKPLTAKSLMQLLDQVLEKREAPRRQAEMQAQINREAEQFKKDYPDWVLYKEDIKSVLNRHSSLSYVEAYNLAKADNDNRKKRLTKEELAARQRANTRKPGNTGTRKFDKEEKVNTLQDAYNKAKRLLGRK